MIFGKEEIITKLSSRYKKLDAFSIRKPINWLYDPDLWEPLEDLEDTILNY